MSDSCLYLLLAVFFIPVFLIVGLLRKDLWKPMLISGLIIGLWGIVSEYYFFQDYWHPPLLFKFGPFGGPEDFLFGLTLGGLATVGYLVVSSSKFVNHMRPNYWILLLYIGLQIVFLSVGKLLGINSIINSATGLLLFALIVLIKRTDLIKSVFCSAILAAVLLFIAETVLGYLFPYANQRYFYLYGQVYLIFGITPITEFIWALAFGASIATFYPALMGQKIVSTD